VLGGFGGRGMLTMPREASLRWLGALGPAGEERGKPVRSGDGESVVEIGEGAVTSLPTDRRQDGVDNMQGGGRLLYVCARREGDGMAWAR
jgi:hypothetical protein